MAKLQATLQNIFSKQATLSDLDPSDRASLHNALGAMLNACCRNRSQPAATGCKFHRQSEEIGKWRKKPDLLLADEDNRLMALQWAQDFEVGYTCGWRTAGQCPFKLSKPPRP